MERLIEKLMSVMKKLNKLKRYLNNQKIRTLTKKKNPKVTYNMYSCDTCCMSREMMETDGRDCATCQNPSKGDMDGILKFV